MRECFYRGDKLVLIVDTHNIIVVDVDGKTRRAIEKRATVYEDAEELNYGNLNIKFLDEDTVILTNGIRNKRIKYKIIKPGVRQFFHTL